MTRFGSLLSNSDAVTPDAVIEYPGGAISGLTLDSAAAAASNTSVINAAIAAARQDGTTVGSLPNGLGARVWLPAGDIYINDTILIQDALGLVLEGDGLATRLIWQGNDNTKPVVRLSHARQCTLQNITIVANTAALCGIQSRRDNHTDWVHTPTLNQFKNLYIECGNKALYGILLGGSGAVDANNDFNRFDLIYATNYTKDGYYLLGSQAFNNLFLNCHAIGQQNVAEHGVNVGVVGGTFHWIGGSVAFHTVADFALGRSYQPFIIESVNSEQSNALIQLLSSSVYWHIVLRNLRWSGVGAAAPYQIIKQDATGDIQLEMSNCRMGDGQNPTAAFVLPLTLGAIGGWKLDHCTLFSSAENPFPNSTPTSGTGNIQITNEVSYTRKALTWN